MKWWRRRRRAPVLKMEPQDEQAIRSTVGILMLRMMPDQPGSRRRSLARADLEKENEVWAQMAAKYSVALVFHVVDSTLNELTKAWQLLTRARSYLDVVSVFLPKRIANEDVGDAIEGIEKLGTRYRGRFFRALVVTKLISTTFWLFVAAAKELASVIKSLTGF
jgi:hypothetical protein